VCHESDTHGSEGGQAEKDPNMGTSPPGRPYPAIDRPSITLGESSQLREAGTDRQTVHEHV